MAKILLKWQILRQLKWATLGLWIRQVMNTPSIVLTHLGLKSIGDVLNIKVKNVLLELQLKEIIFSKVVTSKV